MMTDDKLIFTDANHVVSVVFSALLISVVEKIMRNYAGISSSEQNRGRTVGGITISDRFVGWID